MTSDATTDMKFETEQEPDSKAFAGDGAVGEDGACV